MKRYLIAAALFAASTVTVQSMEAPKITVINVICPHLVEKIAAARKTDTLDELLSLLSVEARMKAIAFVFEKIEQKVADFTPTRSFDFCEDRITLALLQAHSEETKEEFSKLFLKKLEKFMLSLREIDEEKRADAAEESLGE
jgi:hypothetical protein